MKELCIYSSEKLSMIGGVEACALTFTKSCDSGKSYVLGSL